MTNGIEEIRRVLIEEFPKISELLIRILMRGGLSYHDAEEVAQEAIVMVWAGEAVDRTGEGINDVRAFTCGVARGLYRNFRRKAQRRECVPLDDFDRPTIVEDQVEIGDLVEHILGNLSARDGAVLRDRYWDDLTYDEIGERYGVCRAFAHKRLNSALNRAQLLVA